MTAMDDFRDEVAMRIYAVLVGSVHGGGALAAREAPGYSWSEMADDAYDAAEVFIAERSKRLAASK